MEWLAHSENRFGRAEPLREHLEAVAGRAAEYAKALGCGPHARIAGLLHDAGKYTEAFQQRLQGKRRAVDHWTPSAVLALNLYPGKLWAEVLAIAGHHLGLPPASCDDLRNLLRFEPVTGWSAGEFEPATTDWEQLRRRLEQDGVDLPPAPEEPFVPGQAAAAASMLDARMLYSVLVDADFIETEAFLNAGPEGRRYRPAGPELDAGRALEAVLEHIEQIARESQASEEVLAARRDLLEACLQAAEVEPGLFTLTAPTGSGKTLAMLAFALKHAALHGLRRIICVIPYLSIIEQTASVYRQALAPLGDGEFLRQYVLEHHSLSGLDEGRRREGEEDSAERLLCENWDAPIIVTTSVQFFESLMSNRPSACRKLHRIARSVVLFDEVQTLPRQLAVATLATLTRLVERYGTTVVFATATQPAFQHLSDRIQDLAGRPWKPREIASPQLRLFERLKRVRVRWPAEELEFGSWEDLAERLSQHGQALCIVNTKLQARLAFDALRSLLGISESELAWEDGLFHMSTSMCPAHRVDALAEVRRRLEAGEPCLLVSTQCVEAGVDIDFPVVYRAIGPLEAIAQAAGRCNREGRMDVGDVFIFRPPPLPEGKRPFPDAAYMQATEVAQHLLATGKLGEAEEIRPDVFEAYYRMLYEIGATENPELEKAIKERHFPCVTRLYRLIPDAQVNVLVPYDAEAFEELASEVLESGLTREWMLRAQRHAVGIFRGFEKRPIAGLLEPIPVGRGEVAHDWFIYRGSAYDRNVGLVEEGADEVAIV